jgi:hypothetical protein
LTTLPNAKRAVAPLEKLAEYSLNSEHPTGRHKDYVFRSRLGLTVEHADTLRELVLEAALTHEAVSESSSQYGSRYVVDFEVTTERGTAVVRSTWIIRQNEDFPRLTSCYVK